MSTQVYVQIDGIVNHKHEGVKGWHDPAAKHKDGNLHAQQRAAQPTNLKDLTEDEKAQYKLALGGKSFNYLWVEAKNARVEAGKKTRGPGKDRGLTLEQELDELKAMDALVLGEADVAEEAAFLA